MEKKEFIAAAVIGGVALLLFSKDNLLSGGFSMGGDNPPATVLSGYTGPGGGGPGGQSDSGIPLTKKAAAILSGNSFQPATLGGPSWDQISDKIKGDMLNSIIAPGKEQPASIYQQLLGKNTFTGAEAASVFQYTPKGQLLTLGAYTPKPFYPGKQNGGSFFGDVGKGSIFNKQMQQFLAEPGAAGNLPPVTKKAAAMSAFDISSLFSANRGYGTNNTYGGRDVAYSGIGQGDSYVPYTIFNSLGKAIGLKTGTYYTKAGVNSDIRFASAAEAAAYKK